GGNGHLMMAEQAEHIELSGLVLDGSNRWLADYTQGLLDLRRVAHLAIDNCQVTGSGKNGLALEHVSGRIGRCDVSGAADAGIYSVEAGGLEISGNTVSDCANGGILVHRWQQAEDGTIVSGNRVQRIGARSGGTGQNGNGI
ncbi:MAG: TIGR03808 family TAT-translocated repetitive protein, partial [Mesorhizobium sp.]